MESHDRSLVKPLPRRRESPWLRRVLMFATIVVLVDALFGEHSLAETLRAHRRYDEAQARLAAMRHDNARLRERVHRLKFDPREIEAEARMQLGLVKPGEMLFVIRDR